MASKLSRREALEAFVGTLTAGLAGSRLHGQSPQPAFEHGAIIRTLLRDIEPDTIVGPTLFHEHLSIRYPLTRAMAAAQSRDVPASFSDDVDLMIEETKAAARDGVACIVDGGHPDMDRDLEALKRIAAESALPIVASGGFYMQRNYPPDIASKSADQIAEDLVRDAAAQRLGAFGEIGQQGGVLTDDERKVFIAVAKAQARSGLPIFTHNAYTGTRQVATPIPMDTALKQLARRGVFVGFDRVTLQIVPDAQKVTTILAFLEAGHVDHLLLSSDFATPRALKKNGGPGIAQTVTVFGPMLLQAGVSEATLRHVLVDNPRRFLAFVPRS